MFSQEIDELSWLRDCWHDKFPEHLKDKAPRMEFKDGAYHFTCEGQQMVPVELANILCEAMECNPGLSSVPARLAVPAAPSGRAAV